MKVQYDVERKRLASIAFGQMTRMLLLEVFNLLVWSDLQLVVILQKPKTWFDNFEQQNLHLISLNSNEFLCAIQLAPILCLDPSMEKIARDFQCDVHLGEKSEHRFRLR